jgi:hypothetical protein
VYVCQLNGWEKAFLTIVKHKTMPEYSSHTYVSGVGCTYTHRILCSSESSTHHIDIVLNWIHIIVQHTPLLIHPNRTLDIYHHIIIIVVKASPRRGCKCVACHSPLYAGTPPTSRQNLGRSMGKRTQKLGMFYASIIWRKRK